MFIKLPLNFLKQKRHEGNRHRPISDIQPLSFDFSVFSNFPSGNITVKVAGKFPNGNFCVTSLCIHRFELIWVYYSYVCACA